MLYDNKKNWVTFSYLQKRIRPYRCYKCGSFFKEGIYADIQKSDDYHPYYHGNFFWHSGKSSFGVDLCCKTCSKAFLREFIDREERLEAEFKERTEGDANLNKAIKGE